MYISAIAIDFGSTNSGAARVANIQNGKLTYSTPELWHSNGYYAKDTTWFFIKPELLQRAQEEYDTLADSDFHIVSRCFRNTVNPNIVWGRDILRDHQIWNIERLKNEGWIDFKYFKMMIYLNKSYKINGREYPIDLIVRLFLRIIKIECLMIESGIRQRKVTSDEIQWGITIPSIWSSNNKILMTNICSEVFGGHIRILSEPEGPVISERIHASGNATINLEKGHRSLVVDIGGGTTDICLLEDYVNDEDLDTDTKFIQLASCDGAGIGGNLIDNLFWKSFLRIFSSGLKDDRGNSYDEKDDEALMENLLAPFSCNAQNELLMEDAWLDYKHEKVNEMRIPKEYRNWLLKNGHKEVGERVSDYLCGDFELDRALIYKEVFLPIFSKIQQCVSNFVRENKEKIEIGAYNSSLSVVYAGGMSLNAKLRDLIAITINNLLDIDMTYNVADTPLRASGSIMDGASYILLCRKSVRRKSPYNIFDSFSNITLVNIRDRCKELGCNIKLGELNTIAQDDLEKENAVSSIFAQPIAIKNQMFKDYKTGFVAKNDNQDRIRLVYYGSDSIVVHPVNNKKVWIIGEKEIPNRKGDHFNCIIDFNESTESGNMHYYVTREDTNEVVAEGNLPLNKKEA